MGVFNALGRPSTVPTLSCTLSEVLSEHPEYLGTHPLQTMSGKPELPILIKLIDTKKDLSVQVHPDDEYALAHENGSLGKTEMWYVLDSKPGAELIYGFKHIAHAVYLYSLASRKSMNNMATA